MQTYSNLNMLTLKHAVNSSRQPFKKFAPYRTNPFYNNVFTQKLRYRIFMPKCH